LTSWPGLCYNYTMKQVLVNGCSYAAGWKLSGEKACDDLWCNQLFEQAQVTNLAQHGVNNHWIFLHTAQALRQQTWDHVIVAWTAIPRYHFRAGLELYPTDTKLTSERDIHIVGGQTITRHWQEELGNQLRKIHNDHWDILDLIYYVNILAELAGAKISFVNSLLPWSNNYFEYDANITVPQLDHYTKTLLQSDLRDDVEIIDLYHHIHQHYQQAGGVCPNIWLNLYESLDQLKVDTHSVYDKHPALKSQKIFAEFLRKKMCLKPD